MHERDELEDALSKVELSQWLQLPMTIMFRRKLLERFDAHLALLSSEDDSSVNRLKGRAEVLDLIMQPHKLFD